MKRGDEPNEGGFLDDATRAYMGETNFQRLDRVNELAEEKGVQAPQIALAYVLDEGMNTFAITGAANRAELESSLAALDVELTQSEIDYVDLRSDEK
jgi:aryl-alcohol dehydrogenase-like predicted oxidoreductase